MDDYLSKPLRSEDLDPVLERWLPRGAPRDGDGHARRRARAQPARRSAPRCVERLVDVFARTTPPLLDELRDGGRGGRRRGGAPGSRTSCAGSSETVGALRLSEIARRIELGEDAGGRARTVRLPRDARSASGDAEAAVDLGIVPVIQPARADASQAIAAATSSASPRRLSG